MSTADGKLGVSRIQFGNVVIMPQPAAGGGDNAFQIVHRTDVAPPHSYVAAYLWMQYGFKADAMIHFGTHGSLEFTPKNRLLCVIWIGLIDWWGACLIFTSILSVTWVRDDCQTSRVWRVAILFDSPVYGE